jgi:hypothetical protein
MLIRRLLYRWSANLPARFIDHEGTPYMERHYVGTLAGVRIYLHRFVASDPEGLHDHPFRRSVSLILAGWYWEDRWSRRIKRRWFNVIGPDDFHRVVLPDSGHDVWTLFFHNARTKPWGFMREIRKDNNGFPVYEYHTQSEPNDPAYSSWFKTAPKAQELRATARNIPLGKNAYSAGLAPK